VYAILVAMDVGVREFRENLRALLARVKDGQEIVLTERGKPIARVSGTSSRSKLDELIARGMVTPARKPKTRVELDTLPRMRSGSMSEIVVQQRRGRR
jgi:prevent-host-death family protein